MTPDANATAERENNTAPDLAALGRITVTDGKRIGRLWDYNPGTGFCVIRHLSVPGLEWTASAWRDSAGDAVTGRVAPFPPTPLNYFLIEPGQAPQADDYISFGGHWWRVDAADADAETFTTPARPSDPPDIRAGGFMSLLSHTGEHT